MPTLNKAQLLASFPDNNIGQILPFNMRDFVDSVELKYDNFTVVKPGQPLGNKFPDPVGGKVTLPAGSVWLINGSVSTLFPLHLENNATILGLTDSINTDVLSLDPTAGAVALINSGDNGTGDGFIGQISNVTLDSGNGSGRLFNVKSPLIFTVRGCALVSLAMGSVDSTNGASEIFFVDCINLLSSDSLKFTGAAGGRLVFRGMRSGYGNIGSQFEILGNFGSIFLDSCFNDNDSAMFIASEGSTPVGVISGNGASQGTFIGGVLPTSINWTFSGNTGIENASVLGSVAMSGNAVATVNAGVDVWSLLAGVTTLSGSASRFTSPAASTLKYVGKEAFKGVAFAMVSIAPTADPASSYEITLFKNGVQYTDAGITYVASAILANGTKESLSIACPVSAVTGDEFSVRVRNRTSATPNIVASEVNFVIR